MSNYKEMFDAIEKQQQTSVTKTDVGREGSDASDNIKAESKSLVGKPVAKGAGLASEISGQVSEAVAGIKSAYEDVQGWLDISFGYEEQKKAKGVPDPSKDGGFFTEGDPESSAAVNDENALRMQERARMKQYSTPTMKDLEKDRTFMDGMGRLKKAHPKLPEQAFKNIIAGESAGDTSARNEDSGAVSLWQITPTALKDLKELKKVPQELTLSKIRGMDAGQQMDLYSTYLDRWGYDGTQSLGVLQAAPGYRNSSLSTVIYKKNSKAWDQNPGWRPSNNGDITGQSIDDYYFSKDKK